MSADSVIVVARRKKFGVIQRFYLASVMRSAWLSLRRLLRNLRSETRDDATGVFTIRYPEERAATPAAFRGVPALVAEASGAPRCSVCGACEAACPTRCIRIQGDPSQGLRGFTLDLSRCIFCGACEASCDDRAIVMSPHVEAATFDRASLVFHLDELLVPAELLAERLRFLDAHEGPPPEPSEARDVREGPGA